MSNLGILVAGLILGLLLLPCSLATKETKVITKRGERENRSASSDIPTVQFCELLKEPFRYESRAIRIKGKLTRFREYVTFYDSNCVPKHPLIAVAFSPSLHYDAASEAGKSLGQIITGNKEATEGNVSVFVTALGSFDVIPASKRQDFTELQYRFTITEIEEMTHAEKFTK